MTVNQKKLADVLRVYWENGYTVFKEFKGEYYLLFNPNSLWKVRIYENGQLYEYQ